MNIKKNLPIMKILLIKVKIAFLEVFKNYLHIREKNPIWKNSYSTVY